MNIAFNFIAPDGNKTKIETVGRNTRTFFKKQIGTGLTVSRRGEIHDTKDNGVEWELCEALGCNPGRYVGRVAFDFTIWPTTDNRDNGEKYEVHIGFNKVS